MTLHVCLLRPFDIHNARTTPSLEAGEAPQFEHRQLRLSLSVSPRPRPRHHHHHHHQYHSHKTVAPSNCRDPRWRPILQSPPLGVILPFQNHPPPYRRWAFANWRGLRHSQLGNQNRGHSPGYERCQTPHGLPRQLRPPPDPAKPVSLRYLLPPVEVRGTTDIALASQPPNLPTTKTERTTN